VQARQASRSACVCDAWSVTVRRTAFSMGRSMLSVILKVDLSIPPPTVLTLGQRIRRALEARHPTQARLAAEAGISQGYLSQLEQDEREPTLSIAARLAGALAWPLPGPFSLRNFSKNPNLATAPRGPVLCSGSAAMSRSAHRVLKAISDHFAGG